MKTAAGIIAALALSAVSPLAASAATQTLTFDGLSGTYSGSQEAGFDIAATDGVVATDVDSPFGTGAFLYREAEVGMGIHDSLLTITELDATTPFLFTSVDISAIGDPNPNALEFQISGWFGGSQVGYISGDAQVGTTQTVTAGDLFGQYLDTLLITFSSTAGVDPSGHESYVIQTSIDNLVLDNLSPVPLPAGGLLLISALGGIGFARRKRR